MAHFMIENSFISTSRHYGPGLDSPRPSRFQLTNVDRSPRPFRKQQPSNDSMWVNFKNNGNGSSQTGQDSGVPSAGGIMRQNSSQSSFKSNRSSKTASLKKKIQEHAFQRNAADWQKEQEYKIIRERRKKLRQQIDIKLLCVRRLFIPAILGMILGVVVLFGSTIRTLGDGTVFWTHREQLKYVGVSIILVGVVLLLTAVGLETHSLDKLKEAGITDVKPFIHPDFLLEEERNHRRADISEEDEFGTNCSGLERQQLLCEQEHNDGEDGFLCSSISSATSYSQVQGIDLTSKWARAMAMTLEINDAGPASPRNDNNTKTNLKRNDSAQLRALHNAPCIEITTVDETLLCRTPSGTSMCGSMSRSSGGSSLQTMKFTENDQSGKSSNEEPTKNAIALHDISEES